MVALHHKRLGQIRSTGRRGANQQNQRHSNKTEPMMESLLRDLRQPEYVHVLLNPLPVYGLAVALIGLLIAIFLRSRRGQIVALTLVLITSASAWPVYELGEQSSDRVLSMSDEQGRAWLEEHQHRAEQLIAFFYVLAAVSLAA